MEKVGNNQVSANVVSMLNTSFVCTSPAIMDLSLISSTKCDNVPNGLICCGGKHMTNGGQVGHCHKYDFPTDTWVKFSNPLSDQMYGMATVALAGGNIWFTGE